MQTASFLVGMMAMAWAPTAAADVPPRRDAGAQVALQSADNTVPGGPLSGGTLSNGTTPMTDGTTPCEDRAVGGSSGGTLGGSLSVPSDRGGSMANPSEDVPGTTFDRPSDRTTPEGGVTMNPAPRVPGATLESGSGKSPTLGERFTVNPPNPAPSTPLGAGSSSSGTAGGNSPTGDGAQSHELSNSGTIDGKTAGEAQSKPACE